MYVNQRVNYPIKRVLCRMEDGNIIDISNEEMKFSVSTIAIQVVVSGLKRFISSWNSHSIPGNSNISMHYASEK